MRCRFVRKWMMIPAVVGSALLYSPPPLGASLEGVGLPPDRVDAIVAPIALYPDGLLAKLLIAATYPLEVDEAQRWLQKHKALTGAGFDHALAGQLWDDSIKDLARVPAVLSMMDDRLEWTQNLGDTFLAQQRDVLASIQRLRAMALKSRILHSTAQQKVTGSGARIVIEPAAPQVLNVPYYDSRVAYGQWRNPACPPMWWTPPQGYAYGSGIGIMAAVGIPASFWRHSLDWETGRLFVNNAVAFNNYTRVAGTDWVHNPQHRHFVNYSTPELRARYGRAFASGEDGEWRFRGYDPMQPTGHKLRRGVPARETSNDAGAKQRLNVFDDIDQGARERLFSERGNRSMSAARRDNTHFPMGDDAIAAAAVETDTVAAQ